MISLNKVLVPVDFSEPSRKAVTYGLTLAGQFNAGLILAHIVPESSALLYAIPTQLLEIEKEQYAKAAAEIRNLVPTEYTAKVEPSNDRQDRQHRTGVARNCSRGKHRCRRDGHTWPAAPEPLVHRIRD